MKKEEIREKFYEETGLDYWDAGASDSNWSNEYVLWLEQKFQQNQTKEDWMNVEEKPDAGKPVLILIEWESVSVKNGKHTKRDVLRARWIPKHFEIDHENFSGDTDYDEKIDEYYWPEGWYETNRHEEINWMVDENVIGWRYLPKTDA